MSRIQAVSVFLLMAVCVFADQTPQEYDQDILSDFQKDIRRGEIVFFGTLPFTMFICLEAYDIYRYFDKDQDPQYIPWPFQTQTVPYGPNKSIRVLVSALSVSFLLAVSDFIIGKIREKNSTPDS